MRAKTRVLTIPFLISLISLFAAGCLTPTGPMFKRPEMPPSGKSIVYFYRMNNPITNASNPGIIHNGQKVLSSLPNRTFWKYSIKPGVHAFEPKLFGIYKKGNLTISNKAPGKTYYVELVVNFGEVTLKRRSPETAISQMPACSEMFSSAPGSYEAASQNNGGGKITSADATDWQSTLHVKTVPANSRIRIMNIKPKFKQGIKLSPGRYHIEVTSPNYEKYLKWISLKEGETLELDVRLTPKKTSAR